MPTCASSAGTSTRSAGATPVKSSIYTCRYLGAACPAPSPSPPAVASARLRATHCLVACGGGCASSNSACDR
eukprot:2867793-Pleurochrysis_carterae.AAC.1